MARFLYITEADLSIDNGEGINEREFVLALSRNHAEEVICVAPTPAHPDRCTALRVVYVAKARRRNPFGYAYHILSLWRRIRALQREHRIDALVFRLGAIPIVPWICSRRSSPKVILKYLGGNPEHRTLKIRVLSFIRTPLYRMIARRVVAADTPSGPLSEWTQEKLGIAPARLQVVPFGANVELFRPGDAKTARSLLGLDSDVQVVGYTGALSSIRHVDLLIEAFSRLVSERGKESLRLLLVGDGAERAELELLAKRLGVGDCVRFAGTVRYEHVPRLLQACTIGVDLSRVAIPLRRGTAWASYSQKIAQYLAVGLPVVAWDIDDNRYLVEHDVGRVASLRGVEGVLRAIETALTDAERRGASWPTMIRAYAESNLSQESLAEKRVKRWRSVVGAV